ncbi:Purine permease 21 [Linum grandiflorum]
MGGEAEEEQTAIKIHVLGLENQSVPRTQQGATWWIRVGLYAILVLAGQSTATLLGRLYYDKGGDSKWMATIVESAAFPILLPLYFLLLLRRRQTPSLPSSSASSALISLPFLAISYFAFGILTAAFSLLYAVGLKYLPVSTYSLICATQLGFNAFFSFFLNSQKFTPYIINSLVLLTLSSVLLVFQSSTSGEIHNRHYKFTTGFLCTVGASAGYGLMLSLTQLFIQKVFRKATLKEVLDILVYPSAVATAAAAAGLMGSGEWRSIRGEIERFAMGRVSYVMTLVWTAICWQVYSIGCVGLIFEVSSLFSNVIATFGLPLVPVLAVFFFRDRMDGLKAVAMVLALWGFVSYVYQHYLDHRRGAVVDDDRKEESGSGITTS